MNKKELKEYLQNNLHIRCESANSHIFGAKSRIIIKLYLEDRCISKTDYI